LHDYHTEEDVRGKAVDMVYIRRLLGYARPYVKLLAIVVVLLLALTAIDLIGPRITANVIDNHIKVMESGTGDVEAHLSALRKLAFLLLGLYFAHAVLTYFQMYALVKTGQNMVFDLRRNIFEHLQKLSLTYFDKNPSGRLITRVTNDVNVINEAFSGVLVYLFKDFFLMAGIAVVLFLMDVRLTLVVLAPIPLVAVVSMIFRRMHRDAYRWTREAISKVNVALHEAIAGVNIIKIFAREKQLSERFYGINENNFRANFKIIILSSIFNPMIMVLTNIPIALLLWYGGLRVLGDYLTVGKLYVYLVYLRMFFQPIADFSQKYILMQAAMAASERFFRILDTKDSLSEPEKPIEMKVCRGEIEFQNVCFSYGEDVKILKNVSFIVKQGETVALVGSTGSGKTTVTSLACRFYDVTSGKVLVDGVDVRDREKADLRRNIAIVMQDTFMFSESVRDNIRLSTQGISDEDVRKAAIAVGAEEFILGLPGGYGEVLQERGVGLSVGQRQLIAFARALAHNRKILILDEATSSIDTKTEVLIQKATLKLLKGRTAIVVAHRLSTIKHADTILVLEHGEIVERGTHRELLDKKGRYNEIYQLQFMDQENQ